MLLSFHPSPFPDLYNQLKYILEINKWYLTNAHLSNKDSGLYNELKGKAALPTPLRTVHSLCGSTEAKGTGGDQNHVVWQSPTDPFPEALAKPCSGTFLSPQ